jgi:hypothetical protein
MNKTITWGLRVSILLFAILHFITAFSENIVLTAFLSICGFLILLFASLHLTVQKIKLPLTLFLIATLIILFSDTSIPVGFLNGFLQMRNVIGLLIIIPIISWVLNEDHYIEAIIGKARNLLDTSRKMYLGITSFTQVIAYFLLFGAIPLMYQLVNMVLKNEKGEAWENYKGTAMLRGFALSVLWVVSIPSFIFVVEIINASLWVSILQGLCVSVCGILVSLVFSYFDEKRYGVDLTTSLKADLDELIGKETDSDQHNKRLIREFILLFVSLFGSILLLNAIFNLQLMLLIPLVVLCWTFIYFLVKKRIWKFLENANRYVKKPILDQSYQLSIMLGAGMLIYGLNQTGFGQFVVNGINALQELIPFINVLHLLPFMVLILGFLGLGPLTVVVLVGGILQNLHLPYAPELIVLTVTSGSALSILLSPLLMPVIVLSNANGLNSFKNGMKFNWKYATVIYVMVQVYVQTMIHL